jgi:hypothetical protein
LGITLKGIQIPSAFDAFPELLFRNVSEGRVAQIMGESCRFGYIWIDAPGLLGELGGPPDKLLGESTSELGDTQGMSKTIVEDVAFMRGYDLSNPAESPKCGRVEDPVIVTLGGFANI